MAINKEKVLLLSVMRNEGPYVLEWLAHHFSLGIDDLLIFTNGCTDNTDKILDRLEVLMPHRVKHQPNPKVMFPDRGRWHIMALRYAGHFGRCKAADWLYVTDADEFLNLKGDLDTLDQFFEASGPADVVSFTSVSFNSNNQKHASAAPVTERFTQTSSFYEDAMTQNKPVITAVKTLYRNAVEGPRRPHRPVTNSFSQTGYKWINGSGEQMPPEFTNGSGKAINAIGSREFGQVNHYAIKSAAEFLLKVDRGDAVHADRLGASEQYWRHGNRPGDDDFSGAALSKDAQDMFEHFLADNELRELHEESFVLREARLQEILKTQAVEELARAIGYFD